MTNEMDLHSTNHVPKTGTSRVTAYYYAVLILSGGLITANLESGTWRLVTVIILIALALLPVASARRKRRKLQEERASQLSRHRNRAGRAAETET